MMELGVKQRLILLGVLAGQGGDLTELRILRELREALSFSEEEHAELQPHIEGDRMIWNMEKDVPTEVEIGEVAKSIIVRQLKELNRNHQLRDEHLDIIDLFPEVE